MSKEITIKEAKEARQELHRKLSEALDEFTIKTGLGVDNIIIETKLRTFQQTIHYIVCTTVELNE